MRIWHPIFNNYLAGSIGTSLCLITRLYCWNKVSGSVRNIASKYKESHRDILKVNWWLQHVNTQLSSPAHSHAQYGTTHTAHTCKHTQIHIHMHICGTPHTCTHLSYQIHACIHTNAHTWYITHMHLHTHTHKQNSLMWYTTYMHTQPHIPKIPWFLNFFLQFLYFRIKKQVILNFKELSLKGKKRWLCIMTFKNNFIYHKLSLAFAN